MIHLLPDVVNIKQKEKGEKIKWHTPVHTCTNARLNMHMHMPTRHMHAKEYTHACAHTTLMELTSTWEHTKEHRHPEHWCTSTKSSLWELRWGYESYILKITYNLSKGCPQHASAHHLPSSRIDFHENITVFRWFKCCSKSNITESWVTKDPWYKQDPHRGIKHNLSVYLCLCYCCVCYCNCCVC